MPETDELLDATTALIPPLLTALDALRAAGRHMHPPMLPELVEAIRPQHGGLVEGFELFKTVTWPEHLETFVDCVTRSVGYALRAFAQFEQALEAPQPAFVAYRAMGLTTKAIEALYPVAAMLPPVSRFYLEPQSRDDAELLERLAAVTADKDHVGLMHANNSSDERGGFSVYVPEYYAGEAVPLVFALHGGSGHGRQFIWSWLRAARSLNCIVIAPTSLDNTWSLMDPGADAQRLHGLVDYAKAHWNIDNERILLSGMSDGGTFSYVAGLQDQVPYTHLAPCSASFHPMLIEAASPQRLQGLPIYLIHGALDWMFPVDVARTAQQALQAAGAAVVYAEVEDLSHTYPEEYSAKVLDWLKT
jgi:phospholipase/carboxylesterase